MYKIVSGKQVALSTQEQQSITTEWNQNAQAKQEYEAKEAYKDKRSREYPSMSDQLDAIWKQIEMDKSAGKTLNADTDSVLNNILAVKTKHPKPEIN